VHAADKIYPYQKCMLIRNLPNEKDYHSYTCIYFVTFILLSQCESCDFICLCRW